MNWSNLPAEILEKIMYFAAQKEEQKSQEEWFREKYEGNGHKWLLTLEKFSRVSVHWNDVVFNKGNKNLLFPADKAIDFFPKVEWLEEAMTLLKAGFLSVVKKISILGWSYPEASKYIGNIMETSLRSIYIRFNIYGFTDENLLPIMDIISKSPNADYFQLFIRIESQNDAVLLWQLLLKIVHCNSKPKRICLSF